MCLFLGGFILRKKVLEPVIPLRQDLPAAAGKSPKILLYPREIIVSQSDQDAKGLR
jgi:hypothetical protein